MPGVLLVLGGVHAGIVGHADDHAGVDPRVGDGKQGVGGHVHPHVLHDAGAALACQGGAEGHLHGHLLVGGPLAVDLVVPGGLLGDLRTGGARITGNQAASGLVQPPGHRLISQHQLLHTSNLFPETSPAGRAGLGWYCSIGFYDIMFLPVRKPLFSGKTAGFHNFSWMFRIRLPRGDFLWDCVEFCRNLRRHIFQFLLISSCVFCPFVVNYG